MPGERKNAVFTSDAFQPQQTVLTQVPIHYSNLALIVKRSAEQAAKDDAEEAEAVAESSTSHYVAKRLRYRKPRFDYFNKTWTWRREAASVARIDKEGKSHAVEWSQKDKRVPWMHIRRSRSKSEERSRPFQKSDSLMRVHRPQAYDDRHGK